MYSASTLIYGIPYMKDGDTMTADEEERRARIEENLFRAAILAEGETRVFLEGNYTTVRNPDNSAKVTLIGNPAIRGVARSGLVEVNGQLVWDNLSVGLKHYLYLQATQETYADSSLVTAISSLVPRLTTDLLFLATLDNTTPGSPVLDTDPPGKPTGSNLFELLNSPINPFGDALTQSNLTVGVQLVVNLGQSNTVLIKQLASNAAQSPITIQNTLSKPEIKGTPELRLSDSRNPGFALTDPSNTVPVYNAISLMLALRYAARGKTVILTDAPIILTDASLGNVFYVKLQGNRTLNAPANPWDGQRLTWQIQQDAVGTRTLAYNPIFRFGLDISSAILSTSPNHTDYLEAIWNARNGTWDVVRFVRGYA